MTSGLIITNPHDDKCQTPRDDGVYEHCDPKFSLDTHKDSSLQFDVFAKRRGH